MRTTRFQFEMLVGYMERNGDITKIKPNPLGKARMLMHWEEVARILNNNGTGVLGPVRTIEQWKKVWCDFKNNIKKKLKDKRTEGGHRHFPDTCIANRVLAIINNDKPIIPGIYNEGGDSADNDVKTLQLDVDKAMDLLSNSDSDIEEISGDDSPKIIDVDFSIQNFSNTSQKSDCSSAASPSTEKLVPDIEIKQEKESESEPINDYEEVLDELISPIKVEKNDFQNDPKLSTRKTNVKCQTTGKSKNMTSTEVNINDTRNDVEPSNEFRGHKHNLPNIVPVIVRKPYRRNLSACLERNFNQPISSHSESSNRINTTCSEKTKIPKEQSGKNIEKVKDIDEITQLRNDPEESDNLTIVTNNNAIETEASDNEQNEVTKVIPQNNIVTSNQVGLRQILLSKLQQKKNCSKKSEKLSALFGGNGNENSVQGEPSTSLQNMNNLKNNVADQSIEPDVNGSGFGKRKRPPTEQSTRRLTTKKRKAYTTFIDNEQRIFEREMAVKRLEIEKEEIKMKTKALEIFERLLIMAETFFISSS